MISEKKAYEKTEREVVRLARKLKKEFKISQKEMAVKLETLIDTTAKEGRELYDIAIAEKDVVKQRKLLKEYKAYMRDMTVLNKQYQLTITRIARDLTRTNEIANSMINGYASKTYTDNYKSVLYEVNNSTVSMAAGVRFDIYNEKAVGGLLTDRNYIIPKVGLSVKEDIQYNRKAINRAMAQAIIQGESIPQIAARVAKATNERNFNRAIRNARTYMTAAQNKGRLDSGKDLMDMGVVLEKEWSATLDKRVRDSHKHLNGERVPYDQEFSNGLLYPGDMAGEPEEVYNCRCRMLTPVAGFNSILPEEKRGLIKVYLHGVEQ